MYEILKLHFGRMREHYNGTWSLQKRHGHLATVVLLCGNWAGWKKHCLRTLYQLKDLLKFMTRCRYAMALEADAGYYNVHINIGMILKVSTK
jgi:hypothetical protein